MSKTKKKHASPNFPATVLLRPRLDALWQNPALPQQSDAEIQAALDELARGVKPDFLVPTLIRAYLAAPATAQSRLDALLPAWLRDREHIATLAELIATGRLDAELHEAARAWLTASGANVDLPVRAAGDLFYKAYALDNGMQGMMMVLWYANERKNRLYGMSFLIDHNPPWDDAVKDVMVFPKLDPRDMQRRFVETWAKRGETLAPIDAPAAKTKILNALTRNRASEIRLPRDLIANRSAFAQFVLALPDAPDTPRFTDDDWEHLSKNGPTPEELARSERKSGYRTRMEDGKELRIFRDPDMEDDF